MTCTTRRRAALVGALRAAALPGTALPGTALACACGCGVFQVGGGGSAFIEYDFMNQGRNWAGAGSSPAGDNPDKDIGTSFATVGAQYMYDDGWGWIADLPYWQRHFKTIDDSGAIVSFDHGSMGDIRLLGVYSGLEEDMSTSISFGLKLPTGDASYPNFDADTEIGTGSTDLLLGASKMGRLTDDANWTWFVDGQYDQPMLIKGGYRPGAEVDAAAGVYYNGLTFGASRVAPFAEMIGSYRWHDTGVRANPTGSGYRRLVATPGTELLVRQFRVSASVGLPFYEDVRDNQLVASALYKLNVSYSF